MRVGNKVGILKKENSTNSKKNTGKTITADKADKIYTVFKNGLEISLSLASIFIPGTSVVSTFSVAALELIYKKMQWQGSFKSPLSQEQDKVLQEIIKDSLKETKEKLTPDQKDYIKNVFPESEKVLTMKDVAFSQINNEIEHIWKQHEISRDNFTQDDFDEQIEFFLNTVEEKILHTKSLAPIYNNFQIKSLREQIKNTQRQVESLKRDVAIVKEQLRELPKLNPSLYRPINLCEAFESSDAHHKRLREGRFVYLKFDENLFADIKPIDILLEDTNEKTETLLDTLKNHEGNFIFIGEGGTGKTTSLLRIWEELLKEKKELPLYVPLNEYNIEIQENNFITSYVKLNYRVDLNGMDKPVILLLDGFNEISKNPEKIIYEIKKLSVQTETRIVLTSRHDFITRYGLEGFEAYKLQPLSPKRIRDFWKSVKTANTNLQNINLPKNWQTLLSNPMMLTLFAKTCAVQKSAEKLGLFPFKHAQTKGELIYNYLLCQLNKPVVDNQLNDLYCTYIALFCVAPYVAWRMENNGTFHVSMDECEQQITEYLYKNKSSIQTATTKFLKKVTRTFLLKWEETTFDPLDVLVNQFYLLTEENGRYTFQHQYFRDFFSALHIDNSLEKAFVELNGGKAFCIPEEIKKRELPSYIADMLGGYYGDYQNQESCIVKNNLHKLLDYLRGLGHTQTGFAVNNIIDVWRTSRRDQIVDEILSNLDLTNVPLNNVLFSSADRASCFNESIISDITFLPQGHSAGIKSGVYSANGSCILTASYDGTVREWDRQTGECLRIFKGHASGVETAVYSADGSRILSASGDRTVREWNRETGKCIRIFKGHTGFVYSVVYSADGSRILSASRDGTVREWNRETGKCIRIFKGHTGFVYSAVYSADGMHILTASGDGTVREWNRETGKCIWATPPYGGVFMVGCNFKDCKFDNDELKQLIRRYGGKI